MIDFDETRKNIRSTSMSDNERKEMFQKFVDGGGKVLSDKEKRRHKVFDREKQKEFRQVYDERRDKHSKKNVKPKTKRRINKSGKKKSVKSQSSGSANPVRRLIDLIRIRFNLYILGVTDFSGLNIKTTFIDRFNSEYKSAAIELQLVYLEIFKNSGTTVADKIITYLDKQTPLHFELLILPESWFVPMVDTLRSSQLKPSRPETKTSK